MNEDRIPILVGAGQLTQRDATLETADEPLVMLEQVARAAAEDARAGDRLLAEIDLVSLVDVVVWKPQNAPRLIADALGAKPRQEWVTSIGGEMGVAAVNHAAREIAAGRSAVGTVLGCNNLRTLIQARKQRTRIHWTQGGSGTPQKLGVDRPGQSEREERHGMKLPIDIYPLFENAIRARRGTGLEEHRRGIGELFHSFTKVAARNPYAWFPTERSAQEISRATPENRMIAYPYTKYMNAILNTDQAAALVLTSVAKARALGIPEDRWVYWWGGADAEEAQWFMSERPDVSVCPAMQISAEAALAEAGTQLAELDAIDLYSCFPAAVGMACDMLGLAPDDPRGLTVTGGLPYAGGPGSSYTVHSIATMMDRLREKPGSKGLVTGNGWYLTKHAACVMATQPPDPEAKRSAPAVRLEAPPELATEEAGRATLETYTVTYGRDGAPERGIVLGRFENGKRFIANTPEDAALLEDLVSRESVGRSGSVAFQDGHATFRPS